MVDQPQPPLLLPQDTVGHPAAGGLAQVAAKAGLPPHLDRKANSRDDDIFGKLYFCALKGWCTWQISYQRPVPGKNTFSLVS